MDEPAASIIMKRAAASASSAAQIFASIDDLLIQVFLRIPLKQLYRLKLVSKHWDSIISDPKLHLSLRNPEPAVGLIFNCRIITNHDLYNPYLSYILYFDKPTTPEKLRERHGGEVLHSCNGLLLCESFIGSTRHYVYNPITKKTSTLYPGIVPWESITSMCGMYLAFDPSESSHYKVVYVVGVGNHSRFGPPRPDWYDRFKFEVYSSETGSWRRCGEPFSATVDFKGGVYWKGSIHWVSLTKSAKSIYFNPVCDDRMLPTVMPSPPILEDARSQLFYQEGEKKSPWYKERNYHFGESCGHLNFIDARYYVFEFNVYEMKNDYSEWFVKYIVDLSNVVASDLFFVCTLVRGKKDDDTCLVLRVGKKFMRCNLVDKTCETILLCEGNTPLEKELLGRDGEFPLHFIEGAFGNVDGVWATEEPCRVGEMF